MMKQSRQGTHRGRISVHRLLYLRRPKGEWSGLFETLKDRLVKELALAEIKSIDGREPVPCVPDPALTAVHGGTGGKISLTGNSPIILRLRASSPYRKTGS